jgi:colanic acid/amylovoran biosynthesis protein
MNSRKIIRILTTGLAVECTYLRDRFYRNNNNSYPSNSGENIVITGGELYNKGAQAMTFTVVDQISRRYPNKSIYLFSTMDYFRDEKQKDKFTFNILPWDNGARSEEISTIIPSIYSKEIPEKTREEIKEVLNSCLFCIDISGYALSSQCGVTPSIMHLSTTMAMRENCIPQYIFPQSIGPFEYSTWSRIFIEPLLRQYLPYPEIFPREEHGVEYLREYLDSKSKRYHDIVLQYDEYIQEGPGI